jgi:hypothetical protein
MLREPLPVGAVVKSQCCGVLGVVCGVVDFGVMKSVRVEVKHKGFGSHRDQPLLAHSCDIHSRCIPLGFASGSGAYFVSPESYQLLSLC